MSYELKNKIVLITGAASGIGACIVQKLLEENVKHVTFLDVDNKMGVAYQDELQAKYGSEKVKFYQCDVTKEDQLFGAYKSVYDELGYIDLVINNAGIMNDSPAVYKKEIEINFTAVVTSTFKALELMRKDEGGKGGTVINISSRAALGSTPTVPVYHATKSAVLQFDICLSFPEYYALTGVRILTVCFGLTNTAIISKTKMASFDKWLDDSLVNLLGAIPSQRVESAALGLLEVYKRGEYGTTWMITDDEPAVDITANVKRGYEIMGRSTVE